MCSRNDDDDGPSSIMEIKVHARWFDSCQKCSKEKPVIQIPHIKHAYCRDCFLVYVNHKFRSTLGKSKMMRPSDTVLAAFSGSLKSSVLLHLLQSGFSELSHKRFLFRVKVLYIDEGAILGIPLCERISKLQSVAEILEHYGFSAYYALLSSVFDCHSPYCFPLNKESTLTVKGNSEEDLVKLFQSIGSLTAKEDLLKQLRKKILNLSAKELECNKIFTAETSTDLAIQLLTDMSLGRGSHVHHDVTFCDKVCEDLKFMRPLLELSCKEAVFYAVFFKLQSVFIPSLNTKASSDSSIHNLSSHFVMELMENFPSTVSTVFRTGEKLGNSTNSSLRGHESCCVLCMADLSTSVTSCSSVQATEFSRLISSLGPLSFDNTVMAPMQNMTSPHSSRESNVDDRLCCSGVCECGKHSLNPTLAQVEENCCYGCRLILREMKNVPRLPPSVLHQVIERSRLKTMSEDIREFLL